MGNGPDVLSIRWCVGGSNSVIFQSSRRALPLDRIVVLTVLPTPIGSGEVSSSLSTLSSHRGRLRASATNANTSSIGFAIVTETLRVNILCSLRRLATLFVKPTLRQRRQYWWVRILVVDDEPQLRGRCERALKLEGYEVDARRRTARRR